MELILCYTASYINDDANKCKNMLTFVVFLFALLASTVGIAVEDFYHQRSKFQLGQLYFVTHDDLIRTNNYDGLIRSCIGESEFASRVAFCHYNSAQCDDTWVPGGDELSHLLNYCSRVANNEEKEFLLQESIAQSQENVIAMKNLAFHYEWYGRCGVTIDLYERCSRLTGDIGCLIHSALASPPILWTDHQSRYFYLRTISKLFALLSVPVSNVVAPLISLREIPLNVQYNGHNINLATELLGLVSTAHYEDLSKHIPVFPIVPLVKTGAETRIIRLGVLSESHGNSSPGLCIHKVLQRLIELNEVVADTKVQLVFFDRPGLNTIFAVTMRSIAVETIIIDDSVDLIQKAQTISATKVDILLYLALPTEKLSYFLAHLRLAPIQVQFGLGHPFSSGISTTDYSVISRDMVSSDLKALTSEEELSAVACGYLAHSCEDLALNLTQIAALDTVCPSMPHQCMRNTFHYVEQRVVFDTLGYFTEDPIAMYRDDADIHQQLIAFANHRMTPNNQSPVLACSYLNEKFREWGVYPNITAEEVGCFYMSEQADGSSAIVSTPVSVRLYSCMHIVKKFHPRFDAALLGILARDPGARLVGLAAMRHIFSRLVPQLDAYGLSSSDLYAKILLVDRLPHTEYLSLLGLSSVFLNPYPFGSGVSSSDALAMCVPLVVLPEQTEILHFALGQVVQLGSEFVDTFVVHNVDDYVTRAVEIAQGSIVSLSVIRDSICQKKERLFGADYLAAVTSEWKQFLTRL